MSSFGFEVIFVSLPSPLAGVWRHLSDFLVDEGFMPPQLEMSQIAGHSHECRSENWLRLSAEKIEKIIEKRNLTGFHVGAGRDSAGVSYALVVNDVTGEAVLRSRVDRDFKGPQSWGRLIELLLQRWPGIGAWQWHSTYAVWQGASELHKNYEIFYGVIPQGARRFMRQRGSGSAREYMDTSGFPGRSKQILPMVSFHPSAEMWLGPDFWRYAKCTKEEVLAADFFLEKRDTPHFLYLKSWQEPFTRPDGEQGRQQQRLWKLFFHEDCEWPPGSGGICDEPMYGPPELMPGYKAEQE